MPISMKGKSLQINNSIFLVNSMGYENIPLSYNGKTNWNDKTNRNDR